MDANISVDTVFCIGDKVRIIKGPLEGQEGILTTQKGKHRFGIQLKEINQSLLVDISISMIEKK